MPFTALVIEAALDVMVAAGALNESGFQARSVGRLGNI
jgi:hypothetical protein